VEVEVALKVSEDDTVYLEVDGHMCPTRDTKRDNGDRGFREAKTVIAFNSKDISQVSHDRREILDQVLKAKITGVSDFDLLFEAVHKCSNASDAARVVALADGARWIWNLFQEVVPEAIQILDFSHAKSYLYKAGELIYGKSE